MHIKEYVPIVRNTIIDWSNFEKLRNEKTFEIEAAICNKCQAIIRTMSEKRFNAHR